MKISQFLLILFLPLVIVLSNLLFLINNFSFYETIYKKENVYQNFDTVSHVTTATEELIGYFRGQNKLEDNIYSIQAKIHLKDVKWLIDLASIINFLSVFIVILTVIFFLKKKKIKQLRRSVLLGSSFTISLVIILTVSLVFNFDILFIKFHQIFFRNNLWLFPQDDNLIKLFPVSFFVEFTKRLLINIFVTVFVLLFLVYFLPYDSKTN